MWVFFKFIYFLRERERACVSEHTSGEEAEREGDRTEAGPRLQAISTELHTGLKLMNCEIMI